MGYGKAPGTTLPRSFLSLCSVWEYSRLDQESLEGHQGQASLEHLGDRLGQSSQEVLPNQLHPRCKRQHGLICIGAPNDVTEWMQVHAKHVKLPVRWFSYCSLLLTDWGQVSKFLHFSALPIPADFQQEPPFACELSGAESFSWVRLGDD